MRDARVEQVDHVSDSDSEDRDTDTSQLTIGIFPSHQGPTYLLMPNKQDKVVLEDSITNINYGTLYDLASNRVHKLCRKENQFLLLYIVKTSPHQKTFCDTDNFVVHYLRTSFIEQYISEIKVLLDFIKLFFLSIICIFRYINNIFIFDGLWFYKDSWLYHLTVVSGAGPNAGTQYEQLVQKLMESDGDPSE